MKYLFVLFLSFGGIVHSQQEYDVSSPTGIYDFQTITTTASPSSSSNNNNQQEECANARTCLECLESGCSWSQPLVQEQQQLVWKNGGRVSCLESCDAAGTDVSCFHPKNYIGLTIQDVCKITDPQKSDSVIVTTTVNQEQHESDEQNEEDQDDHEGEEEEEDKDKDDKVYSDATMSPVATPTIPPTAENIRVGGEVVVSTEHEARTETVDDEEEETVQVADRPPSETASDPSATTRPTYLRPSTTLPATSTANTQVGDNRPPANASSPSFIPCNGFISCHQCQNNNNNLACAFVTYGSCQNVCPELAHVPCFELDGSSTMVSAASVCAAASSLSTTTSSNSNNNEEIGFSENGELSPISIQTSFESNEESSSTSITSYATWLRNAVIPAAILAHIHEALNILDWPF